MGMRMIPGQTDRHNPMPRKSGEAGLHHLGAVIAATGPRHLSGEEDLTVQERSVTLADYITLSSPGS